MSSPRCDIVFESVCLTDNATSKCVSGLEPGSYSLTESFPTGSVTWVPTTAGGASQTAVFTVGPSADYTSASCSASITKDFGNACEGSSTGGHTPGFWSNNNGRSTILKDCFGAFSALNALSLVDANGA